MPALLSRRAFRSYDLVRTVRLTPYRKGMGPTFTLTLYDTHRTAEYGKNVIAYRLTMRDDGEQTVLFAGDDIVLPPGTAIDSDKAVENVLFWLTLEPGDTDSDFFESYTEAQRSFAENHAEALYSVKTDRFGEG
jgi:hypothetical protein